MSASDHVTSDDDSSEDGQSADEADDDNVSGGKVVARSTLHVGGGFRWDVKSPEGGVAGQPDSSDSEADEEDNVEVGTIWSDSVM